MNYPKLSRELLALLQEDQEDYKAFARAYHGKRNTSAGMRRLSTSLREASKRRADRTLEIVHTIKEPTLSNIGVEASEAVGILALHGSIQVMEEVLSSFRATYKLRPEDVFYQVIPALTDRVLVLKRSKQHFGTQWLHGEDGRPFLYPVDNLRKVNDRRARYGLGPLRRPTIVALSPRDSRQALSGFSKDDMRMPTDIEFHEFADDHL